MHTFQNITTSQEMFLQIIASLLLIFIIIKYDTIKIVNTTISKMNYICNFFIKKITRLFTLMCDRATEVSMFINVCLIYQHPPQGYIEYMTFCTYLTINTIVLVKKGNVDIDLIMKNLNEINKKE